MRSNVEYVTMPYVWQINRTLFHGSASNQLYVRQAKATVFGFYWRARRFLETEVPKQLQVIASIPYSVFKLLLGKRSVEPVVEVDYDREVYKDFWNKILKEYYSDSQ